MREEIKTEQSQMISGTMPSIVADSEATFNCGQLVDPFISTGISSGKMFDMPLGQWQRQQNRKNL